MHRAAAIRTISSCVSCISLTINDRLSWLSATSPMRSMSLALFATAAEQDTAMLGGIRVGPGGLATPGLRDPQ